MKNYSYEIEVIIRRIEEEKPNSLIGRKYYPVDNSYIKHILGEKVEGWIDLVGCMGNSQRETIIVSEPYEDKCECKHMDNKWFNEIYTFINVLYQNTIYRVLYFEHGLKKR